MESLYRFIIKPKGERYDNEKKVGDKSLITNTRIETFQSVSKKAIVIALPKAYKTDIKVGDEVIIHHNVFLRFYDMKGREKNSKSYFKDNMYFVQLDQVYLYKPKDKWLSFGDRCFLAPIKDFNEVDTGLEQKLIGIVKIGNSSLEVLGINEEDLVGFKPFGEFDFVVDGKRLYCMKSNDIVIKYERQGNEVEHNPRWAHSC